MRTVVKKDPSVFDIMKAYTYREKGTVYIVAPIGNQKVINGVLVVKAEQIWGTFYKMWTSAFQFIGVSMGIFFIGAAIVGFAFGVVTSRSLVRRIRRILISADRWSQGDFETFVTDPSGDELGELAQRLNQMAMQLQYLLRARQDLATLEERNRRARELHDSVKQQMFAVSIWVSTAKSLIGQDEQAARSHLTEAVSLISLTKQELSALQVDFLKLKGEEYNKYRQDIQMIFQDPYSSLSPRMSVYNIISKPLTASRKLSKSEIKEKVTEIAEKTGLNASYLVRYPHAFSGGQRQRIAIARALASRPRLIVCDEAVVALDVSIQAQIINLLKDLQEQYKITYIFISHDLSVVEHISDRVAVMYLGKIVELAPADALFANPGHPYTEALLSAVPMPDPNYKKERNILEGEVPNPPIRRAAATFIRDVLTIPRNALQTSRKFAKSATIITRPAITRASFS